MNFFIQICARDNQFGEEEGRKEEVNTEGGEGFKAKSEIITLKIHQGSSETRRS